MDKIREKKTKSIKQAFLIYFPVCVVAAYLGSYAIGIGSNNLQEWYYQNFFETDFNPHDSQLVTITGVDGKIYYEIHEGENVVSVSIWHWILYGVISWAQAILIPAWILFCVVVAARIFYKREMENPISVLLYASEQISENRLDFQIETAKENELGRLCQSFENMRQALYENNQKMWRMLEERKRLNAAFSHDMRTPITVLKGYTDLMEKYIPDGKISEDKMLEILGMMNGQIKRLENYTYKMSQMQKLEDITPKMEKIKWDIFLNKCTGITDVLKGSLQLVTANSSDTEYILIDEELVLEVFENLLSNAVRYAENKINISISAKNQMLKISIEDDGKGFSKEAIERAAEPFYREEKTGNEHFGLGLYICKVICEKNQGQLIVKNGSMGGNVEATFKQK